MYKSIKSIILENICKKGTGWAFSAKDFAGKFPREGIDVALYELCKEGKIRRVARGIYDNPAYSKLLQKDTPPDVNKIAYAIARKFSWRIYPDGNTALNYMGLSTQIPAQNTYLSDGPYRMYNIGGQTLRFKHAALKETALSNPNSALVVQSISAIGESNISKSHIKILAEKFSPKEWNAIKLDAKNVSDWIYKIISKIADNKQWNA